MKKMIVVFLLIGLIFTGCGGQNTSQSTDNNNELEKITVVLDWVPNTNHTGLYVAKDLGYYEEVGLDVEIIQPTEGGSADLIASGQGEFGISYQEQLTFARTSENPLPIKAIGAIIQHNTSGFAAVSDKNIKTPKDFEGKTYGGWGSPMEIAMLKAVMENDGGDFEKLEITDIGAVDFFQASEDHIDFAWIYYGWDGVKSKLLNKEIDFMKLQDYDSDLDFYTPIIIAQEEYLSSNGEVAKKFMSATSKGYEYCISNPEEAVESLLKDSPEIDRELALESQKYLANEYKAEKDRWGYMDISIWENFSGWLYERGLLENELDAKEAFTNEYLPE
ncbi:MAG: ABC transporter substrate-binding protein [Firmicutes bacterium]|jgi:ABC-type nitrate/sulfonate/bicarbonate transport system substrate-binding protein|nr:ABC transporter substrate-binding protein [Bacillota bacterium]